MKLYNHLKSNERILIQYMFYQLKLCKAEIARRLKKHRSTICRELKRNEYKGIYFSEIAQKKYVRRRNNKNMFLYLKKYKSFTELFCEKFNKRNYGVEATCNYIKKNYPCSKAVTARQVYNWIKSNTWVLKRSDRLRSGYVKGRKRKKGMFSKLDGKYVFPIWLRNKEIDNRKEYGHFEADLVVGKRSGHSHLLTLTERLTRMVYIIKVPNKNPHVINSCFKKLIEKNSLKVKTITIDNGVEFSNIGILAYWIKCKVYFCEPYASYQRGSNEHSNGLIRRWYKKGTNFDLLNDSDINRLQNNINNIPRKMFNFRSSYEINQFYK